jgi:nucleoside-diphosphate-sugar epimerase
MMKVLLTGAAGGVAGLMTAPEEWRRTDLRPGPGIVEADLTNPAAAAAVIAGTNAVVHLAGQADPDVPWPALRAPNVDVVVNVLDAAVAAGVSRVVLASSLHVMAGHVDAGASIVREDQPPRPCCAYGAVKVLAEALGQVYADQWGLSVVCLRLGGVRERPLGRSWLAGWLSPADLRRLVHAALVADVSYGVYHGVSANTGSVWNIARARAELGYAPQDDSADYADSVPDDIGDASIAPDQRPHWGLAHRT